MREIAICNDDFCNCAIIVSIKQLGDVAMRFRLVAFADEAAPDLAGQIEAMQENGVELLEIRGVDGQNIDGISATKAKVIRKMLGFSGLAVWSLGSPFGKIGINDDFAPHLDSFTATVCQSKLIEVLSRTIKDGRVISLIHKYLNAGVISGGIFEETETGMPQGGPLSPLLSNIMLNELDREPTRRGHRFVRYADDCMIFCKSRKSAERTLRNIIPFIEGKLFLKVNRKKTSVAHVSKVKYLGYAFYRYKGKCRFRVHPKSVKKMKDKIRELTKRSNGWGNEYRAMRLTQFVRGWVNYFSLADMKGLLEKTDEWLRHKIRAVYWKQWKKIKTRYHMIKKYGMPKWKVHEMANCRKGIWRSAFMLNSVLTKQEIASLGYISMTDYYLKVCEN